MADISGAPYLPSICAVGVRIMRQPTFHRWVVVEWCKFRLALRTGLTDVKPPSLAHHRQPQVFFTDMGSLSGYFFPEQLAHRLTLRDPERYSSDGATLIMFCLSGIECTGYVRDNQLEEHTAGGARQWITLNNVSMSSDHFVYYVEAHQESDGSERRPLWFLANPNLENEAFWELVVLMDKQSRESSGAQSPATPLELNLLYDDLEDHEP
ncbi:MAG: hypothetical protein H0V37_04780 [Chloroflexia bacterium]|nr:hypothetical protein [Chloroflexia bacterium]